MAPSLFESLQKRFRPEDVIEMILEVGADLSVNERNQLRKSAKGSLKNLGWEYSSMSTEFFRARVIPQPQTQVASILFQETRPLTELDCEDPAKVESFVRQVGSQIHKQFGEFRKLSKQERKTLGLFKCTRWYNKRYRLICRLEDKIQRMIRNEKKYLMSRVSKSSLAFRIPSELLTDPNTMYLVAYLHSRMSLRSTFTNGPQEKAFDSISAMFLKRCEASSTTNWLAIAYLMPDQSIINRLTETEKSQLLATYWSLIWDAAEILRSIGLTNSEMSKMVVHRGMDSTTWNQAAGGWNKAREHWISLLHALGMEEVMNQFLPGKVMRLMAGDVARWHEMSGKGVHPDTMVWAELPKPWEVLSGSATCTRATVEAACKKHGVKPEAWFGPKLDRKPVPFKPTPELVNGVSIASPSLAAALKKAGYFSGRSVKETVSVEVVRGDMGFAISAIDSPAQSVYAQDQDTST